MKFGQLRLDEAEGALLVHSLRTNERTLRKGRILDANDIVLSKHTVIIDPAENILQFLN